MLESHIFFVDVIFFQTFELSVLIIFPLLQLLIMNIVLHIEWTIELTSLTAPVARMVLGNSVRKPLPKKERGDILMIKYLIRDDLGSSNVLLRSGLLFDVTMGSFTMIWYFLLE